MTDPNVSASIAPARSVARMAGIFAAFALAYGLSEFFRISHAIIGPDLMAELGFAVGGLSLLASIFFVTFAAMQLPNGLLFDKFGPRRTVPAMMLLGIFGAVLFAVADSVFMLSVARAVMGVGWSVTFMGGLITFARWVPTERYALAVAALIFFGTLGNLMATGPWAALVDGVGWRTAMGIMTSMACLSAAFVFAVVRDAPPGHAYHQRAQESVGEMLSGLADVVKIRPWRYVFCMTLSGYAVIITVLALIGPTYLSDIHGLDLAARGQVLLVMTLAMAAGSLCMGPLDRLFDTRKEIVSWCAFGIVAVYAVLALVPGLELWQVTTLFAIVGFIGTNYVVNLAHARAILPDQLVGRGMVTMGLAAFAGSAIAQLIAGLIVDAFPQIAGKSPEIAYRATFAFLGLAMLATAIYHRRVEDAKPSADRVVA